MSKKIIKYIKLKNNKIPRPITILYSLYKNDAKIKAQPLAPYSGTNNKLKFNLKPTKLSISKSKFEKRCNKFKGSFLYKNCGKYAVKYKRYLGSIYVNFNIATIFLCRRVY